MAENTREQSGTMRHWNQHPSAEQMERRRSVAETQEREGWREAEFEGELVRDRKSGRWFEVLTYHANGQPAEVVNFQDRMDFTGRDLSKYGVTCYPTCPRCQCCAVKSCDCDEQGEHAGRKTKWFDVESAEVWCVITGDLLPHPVPVVAPDLVAEAA